MQQNLADFSLVSNLQQLVSPRLLPELPPFSIFLQTQRSTLDLSRLKKALKINYAHFLRHFFFT